VDDELLSPDESEAAYIPPPIDVPPVDGPLEDVGELENMEDEPVGELELFEDPNEEDPNDEEEDPPNEEDEPPNEEDEEPNEDAEVGELMPLVGVVPAIPAAFCCIDCPKNPVACIGVAFPK
jgi:hypothetical protein